MTHIILGIDPGYDRCGWAVVSDVNGRQDLIASGCIQSSSKDSMFERYKTVLQEFVKILKKFQPTECGIENVFFAKNAKTAMRVSEVRGIILGCLLQHTVTPYDYTPKQIKVAITGNGDATKPELERMIRRLTGREKLPKLDDEVDAIAIALCHCVSRKIRQIV